MTRMVESLEGTKFYGSSSGSTGTSTTADATSSSGQTKLSKAAAKIIADNVERQRDKVRDDELARWKALEAKLRLWADDSGPGSDANHPDPLGCDCIKKLDTYIKTFRTEDVLQVNAKNKTLLPFYPINHDCTHHKAQ